MDTSLFIIQWFHKEMADHLDQQFDSDYVACCYSWPVRANNKACVDHLFWWCMFRIPWIEHVPSRMDGLLVSRVFKFNFQPFNIMDCGCCVVKMNEY